MALKTVDIHKNLTALQVHPNVMQDTRIEGTGRDHSKGKRSVRGKDFCRLIRRSVWLECALEEIMDSRGVIGCKGLGWSTCRHSFTAFITPEPERQLGEPRGLRVRTASLPAVRSQPQLLVRMGKRTHRVIWHCCSAGLHWDFLEWCSTLCSSRLS